MYHVCQVGTDSGLAWFVQMLAGSLRKGLDTQPCSSSPPSDHNGLTQCKSEIDTGLSRDRQLTSLRRQPLSRPLTVTYFLTLRPIRPEAHHPHKALAFSPQHGPVVRRHERDGDCRFKARPQHTPDAAILGGSSRVVGADRDHLCSSLGFEELVVSRRRSTELHTTPRGSNSSEAPSHFAEGASHPRGPTLVVHYPARVPPHWRVHPTLSARFF